MLKGQLHRNQADTINWMPRVPVKGNATRKIWKKFFVVVALSSQKFQSILSILWNLSFRWARLRYVTNCVTYMFTELKSGQTTFSQTAYCPICQRQSACVLPSPLSQGMERPLSSPTIITLHGFLFWVQLNPARLDWGAVLIQCSWCFFKGQEHLMLSRHLGS